ncbi:DUF1684 domain-containing protein [Nakamurella leprariae]|uniref:DUF1684 domain-containing protein n=1 Tax=Nakamurella leprariae TaxID=2803911 RepID=A0A938Y4D1_9ACTN|nr:DUF1684 domain-containing protein [Nakamurella leprariae]MBM9465841.1 DUF1684 domain-containing protein [Nakamurella leprariae]
MSTTDERTTTDLDREALEQQWTSWHAARHHDLTAEHGWLSITGFWWLPEAPAALDGLPGAWSTEGGAAVVTATAADGLTAIVDGRPVTGSERAEVPEAGSLPWLRAGEVIIELVLRGGSYAVRARDPQAVTRTGFTGIPAFPVDLAWVRPGRFLPYPEPRRVEVTTARDDLRQHTSLVGEIEVDLPGVEAPQRLQVAGGADGGLTLQFSDETNGVSTARWRALSVAAPDADGRIVVDFNRAVNMPFAFTAYGTCPAPVPGNRLPIAVTAGEQNPPRPDLAS